MGHRLRRLAHVTTQLRGRSLAGCTGEPSTPTESTITQQSAGLTTSGTRTVSTGPGAGAAHSIAETVTLDSMAGKTPASSAVAPGAPRALADVLRRWPRTPLPETRQVGRHVRRNRLTRSRLEHRQRLSADRPVPGLGHPKGPGLSIRPARTRPRSACRLTVGNFSDGRPRSAHSRTSSSPPGALARRRPHRDRHPELGGLVQHRATLKKPTLRTFRTVSVGGQFTACGERSDTWQKLFDVTFPAEGVTNCREYLESLSRKVHDCQ